MNSYVSVYAGDEIRALTTRAIKSIDNVIAQLQNHKSSIVVGNKLHTLGWIDSLRLAVNGLDTCPLAYRNMILNSSHRIYLNYPLAVPLYLLTLKQLFNDKTIDVLELEQYTKKMNAQKKRASSNAIKRAWKKTVQDELTIENFDIICSALDSAGSLGSLEVKRGPSFTSSIHEGISVSAYLDPIFSANVGGCIQLNDCIVLIVEGAILNVSEINRLLVYASESDTPLVIFATKFSNDVANTLAINWQSGKLRVLPLIVGHELNDLNQCSDLASVTSTVFINKDSSISISEINESDLKRVKGIVVDNTKKKCEMIIDEKMIGSTLTLRARIKEDTKEELVDDIRDILNARLARLSSRRVILTVKCEAEELEIIKDRVSSLFSFIKCCAVEGVIKTEDVYKMLNIKKDGHLTSILSCQSVKLAIARAISDYRQITKIGAALIIDK